MVGLKLEQNFLRETGFGLPFGSSHGTMLMDNGQHLEKSILLSQEETTVLELQEEANPSEPLFTGDLIIYMMLMKKQLSHTSMSNP